LFAVVGSEGVEYRLGIGFTRDSEGNRWCLEAADLDTPTGDQILARKLLIEADEGKFRALANCLGGPYSQWENRMVAPARLFMVDEDGDPDIGFYEDPGPLRLETLDEARAWAESQDWDVQLDINRGNPFMAPYEVNGRVSDQRTVDLLMEAARERFGGSGDG
jgi:hypothetical protein